jgi:hypothetical protein
MKDWFWILALGGVVVYLMSKKKELGTNIVPTVPKSEQSSDPSADDIPAVEGYGKFHHDIHTRYVPGHRYVDPHAVAHIGYWPPTGRYT